MMKEEKGNTAEGIKNEVMPVKKPRKDRRPIHDILGGDYLSKGSVIGNLPFLVFLAFLALVYIANTYYVEKTVKEIERTKVELKELRFQYTTTKSTLMYYSKQTEIARRALKFGLKETMIPPYKIFYSGDSTLAFKN
jgi:hypothetical protein